MRSVLILPRILRRLFLQEDFSQKQDSFVFLPIMPLDPSPFEKLGLFTSADLTMSPRKPPAKLRCSMTLEIWSRTPYAWE